MVAPSSSAKHRSSNCGTESLTPRISTPWLRTSRRPASNIALVASATSGVTDWAAFTWVCMATITPRCRAIVATRSTPLRTSSDSQCCGIPISALVASRMSRMFSISSRLVRNASSRGQGMFATSPPDTTTSRTPGLRRR